MDFRHPFLTYRKLGIIYGSFWFGASLIMILILVFSMGLTLWAASVEILSSMILYALFGTAIWYVVLFSTFENNSIGKVLLAHFIAASIMVVMWLYLGTIIVKILNPEAIKWMKVGIANRIFGGYMVYIVFTVFFYAINYYFNFKEKVRNEGKLLALVKEAELHALKSQINPHFLFNSLNSISSLTMTDPARAQEMVINLSQLMRYSLKHNQNEKVLFKQEIENNQLYMQIEKVRFGSKLVPIFEIGENCLQAEIPNMILQPLYENAIKYGVYEATEPVHIKTKCVCKEDFLQVTISNTYDPDVISKKGEGIGLRNIRDRLQIIYGNPHLMALSDNKKEFTVTLTIPQNLNKNV
jgi:hypothetical protein